MCLCHNGYGGDTISGQPDNACTTCTRGYSVASNCTACMAGWYGGGSNSDDDSDATTRYRYVFLTTLTTFESFS